MNELEETQTYIERLTDLKKKKRQNLDKMKKVKRSYVKAKLEKRRINKQIKQLQKEWQERIKNNPEQAKSEFTKELRSVSTSEVFPADLEKWFDKLELENIKRGRTLKTEDLTKSKDLRDVPINVADQLEKELNDEMKDDDTARSDEEATEPDDDTKAQLDQSGDVGLTEGDIFIGEDGTEEEVTRHDEDNRI